MSCFLHSIPSHILLEMLCQLLLDRILIYELKKLLLLIVVKDDLRDLLGAIEAEAAQIDQLLKFVLELADIVVIRVFAQLFVLVVMLGFIACTHPNEAVALMFIEERFDQLGHLALVKKVFTQFWLL